MVILMGGPGASGAQGSKDVEQPEGICGARSPGPAGYPRDVAMSVLTYPEGALTVHGTRLVEGRGENVRADDQIAVGLGETLPGKDHVGVLDAQQC